MKLEDILSYMESAPREELMKIRNIATKLAYPKGGRVMVSNNGGKWQDKTESMRLAELLWFTVKDNYEFMSKPDLIKWAEPIDKLNRIDKRDWKLIQKVIIWATKDDFWKQNVRSGEALRRHFEKCLVKMQSSGALNPPARAVFKPDPKPVVHTEVVDPNSPGYQRFQKMREELARKKDINAHSNKEPRRP